MYCLCGQPGVEVPCFQKRQKPFLIVLKLTHWGGRRSPHDFRNYEGKGVEK